MSNFQERKIATREDIDVFFHHVENGAFDSMISSLESYDIDVNYSDEEGSTALILAAGAGHLSIVEELIKRGALLNAVDAMNKNALIRAVSNSQIKIIEFLLLRGANIRATFDNGVTVLEYARNLVLEKKTPERVEVSL
jgi:ankyrin repeat protein